METLGFVTHELRAPLAAIQTMIDVVVNGYTGDVPEKTASYLQRIKQSSEELQDMVKNYLDLSRAERGELVAEKIAIDFRTAVVDPCLQQTQPLFDSREIDLSVSCPAELEAHADPDLLRIAVTNYLTNAAKYGHAGKSARLEARAEEGQIVATVWNEGAGFTPAEAEALFKKFLPPAKRQTRGENGAAVWGCSSARKLPTCMVEECGQMQSPANGLNSISVFPWPRKKTSAKIDNEDLRARIAHRGAQSSQSNLWPQPKRKVSQSLQG